MPQFRLFTAVTLDGFLAREDGNIDWLLNYPNPSQTDHGYNAFIEETDIILMGRKTYDDVLGLIDEWPYKNQKTYVVTRNTVFKPVTENTEVLNDLSLKTLDKLLAESKKNIWVAGGGKIITGLLNVKYLDYMVLNVVPIILGNGIPIFPFNPAEQYFELVDTEKFDNGIVNLIYQKKAIPQ